MNANPPQYEIRSVHDFAKIPESRRDVCLREFVVWLDLVSGVQAMMEDIPVRPPEAFVWVDDGKHEATVGISGGGQHIHIASGVMKGFAGTSQ